MSLPLSSIIRITALLGVAFANLGVMLMLVGKSRDSRAVAEVSKETLIAGIAVMVLSIALYAWWSYA